MNGGDDGRHSIGGDRHRRPVSGRQRGRLGDLADDLAVAPASETGNGAVAPAGGRPLRRHSIWATEVVLATFVAQIHGAGVGRKAVAQIHGEAAAGRKRRWRKWRR
ncbi:UNVERIFIED_CONTAM: hypothetical protein Sradi_4495900 [Sesamum radiatum]|uniref:Uncharacterized protein n=1 Tax=Sesamum radiatum TaxID=300843 RepID=A0AAW2NBD4_SESRA